MYKSIILEAYDIDLTNKSVISSLGRFAFVIPYIDASNVPSTGTIVNYGVPVEKYSDYLAVCSDFQFAMNICTSPVPSDRNVINFMNYFPNYKIFDALTFSPGGLGLVNTVTNEFFLKNGSSANTAYEIYTSLQSYIDGETRISAGSQMGEIGYYDGSGSGRGRAAVICYSSTDSETGAIDQFYEITLEGVTSTTNSIGVRSRGVPSSGKNNFYKRIFSGAAAPGPGPTPGGDDPYSPGGYSDVSDGDGTFDLTSDIISIPNLPTLSATNAGLVTVYIPTGPQLNTFASLLFGRTFLDAFLNAITTLFVDPLEAVIGLSIIPVAPSLDTAKQVTVAFIGLTTPDGPLMMQPAATQYVEVNCGTIHVDEYSGSALDYAPYSKFHIYLPYIGTRELSTDEIRNKDLKVVYHIDIVSGSCVALLEVDGSVLYQFAGNCATPIPINGRDFSRMVTAGIQLATAFAGGSAGAGVGSVAAGNIRKPADYISTNSSFKTLVKTLDSEEGVMPTANKTAGTGVDAEHLVSATAGVVSGMKPHIQHASGIGGSAGMLGVQKPYLIAEIPRQSLAQDYNKFVGYPSNITSVLSELNGFTQIEMIHLKGIPCTETELSEIDKMLKSGVIL